MTRHRTALRTLPWMAALILSLHTHSGCKRRTVGTDVRCVQFELLRGDAYHPSNVVLFFKLQTCNGDPVPLLRNEDLIVKEDGTVVRPEQSGQTLLPPATGYDWFTVVLLDLSGSVTDAGALSHLQEAGRWFVDRTADAQRVAIYTFDGRPEVEELVPFTSDKGLLRNAIDSLSGYVVVDRSRNLNGAVVSGVALLDAEAANSEAPVPLGAMVLFTDGNDQAGWTTDQEAETAVRSGDHAAYAIGLGGDIDQVHLAALGKDGTRTAVVPEGLIGAFDHVAEQMNQESRKYFVLAYCTMKRAGLHTGTLEIVGKDGHLGFGFSADGFDAGCSTAAMAESCSGRECGTVEGGLWCGSCAAGLLCDQAGACVLNICGNGGVESGEVCDDGNTLAGDGCSADCLSDESCGNGHLDSALGEACDDGNNVDGDGCQGNCALPTCGDAIVDVGETCDDGNNVDGDGCNAQCTSDETCGNGVVDATTGEQCDDGNLAPGDGCGPVCLLEQCGNGFPDPAEACDDGNNVSGDGCSADCLSDETCGNGVVDGPAGEVCDDGNTVAGDGCSADCLSDETCGNGIADAAAGEDCDGPELGGQTCQTLGFAGGTLSCAGNCTLDTSACLTEICGNGNREGSEECDGNDLDGQSCTTLGYIGGSLNCTAGCTLDPAACYTLDTDPNLAAHWKFDDGTGTTALDSSGNGHHGTLVNGPVFVAGIKAGAVSFDGINDYVNVPDAPDIRAQRPMTVAAWIKRDALGEADIIVRKRGGTNDGWGFLVGGDSTIAFTFFGVKDCFSTGTVASTAWRHVATSVSAGGQVRFYIDGSPAGATTVGAPHPVAVRLPMGVNVASDGTITAYTDFLLDDLRIYRRELSEPEIGILATP